MEIVKSIWIQRSQQQQKSPQWLQRSITELHERKQRLIDRLLDATVDRRTYAETDARISEEIAGPAAAPLFSPV